MSRSLQLRDVAVGGRAWIAPMTGVSDLPFRRAASRLGAAYVATEMVACAEFSKGRPDVVRRAAVGDLQRGQQAIDVGAGHKRPGGVVDQHRLVASRGQGSQPGLHRVRPSLAAGDGAPAGEPGQGLVHLPQSVARHHDHDFPGAGG